MIKVFVNPLLKRVKYLYYAISSLALLPIWAYLEITELDSTFLLLSLLVHFALLMACFLQKAKLQFWLISSWLVQALYYSSKLSYSFSRGGILQNPNDLIIIFLPWGLFLFVGLQLVFSTKPLRGLLLSISFYLAISSIILIHNFTFTNYTTFTNLLTAFIASAAKEPWLSTFLGINLFNLLLCYMLAWLQLKEGMNLSTPASYDALHDPLTQLPNRMSFLSQLSGALKTRQSKQKVAVFIIDLDQLKPINDTLGHLVGDEILRQVAHRLNKSLLYKDKTVVSRLGGDEYAVFLKGVKHTDEATKQAQAMVDCLQDPFEIAGQALVVTASIGLSLAPEHGDNNQSLLSKADKAMYHSKALGKNGYQLFGPEMDKDTVERLTLKRRFKKAFESGQLELHYQPIIEFSTEKVARLEALLRWNDEEFGRISPSEFIPLAEEIGLMIPLGEWVLTKACSACQAWQQAGYIDVGVSVNISTLQLMQANFANLVAKVLQKTELKPEHLLLEVTENSIIGRRAEEQLKKLKNLGVQISLDDFGTGYASFAQLKQLAVNFLKIDNSFIVKLGDTKISSYSDNFIRTVIQFCKSQGIIVVAEGIETQTHLNLLRQSSCDEGQGNLISKPLPFRGVQGFLKSPMQNYTPRLPEEFTSLTLNKLSQLLDQESR